MRRSVDRRGTEETSTNACVRGRVKIKGAYFWDQRDRRLENKEGKIVGGGGGGGGGGVWGVGVSWVATSRRDDDRDKKSLTEDETSVS